MKNYSTTFFKAPSGSTQQERIDYDLLFCKRLGIKDGAGHSMDGLTVSHSSFVPHPDDLTNNGYIYAINGSFKKHIEELTGKSYDEITALEKLDFLPSSNFTGGDDQEYSVYDVKSLGWFPEVELIT